MRTHPKITTNIPTLREPFTHMMPRIVNDDVGSDIIPTHVGNGTVYRSYRTIGNAQQPIFMVSGKYTTGAKLAYENAPSLTRNKSGQSETDVPTSPTPTSNDPDTMIATKKYVDSNVVVYPEYKEGILLATVYVGTEPNKKSYKIYTPKQTVTVTFVDWDTTVLKTETVIIGGSATAPADPSRDDYKFAGWDKDFTNVQEDLVVTAQYLSRYTVTFVDYYSGSKTIVAEYTYDGGTTQNIASIAPTVSHTNTIFSEWTADTDDTWVGVTTVNKTTTLYATWAIKSYFKSDGSNYNTQTSFVGPVGQYQLSAYRVTKPSTNPSKSNYTFSGWSPSTIVEYPKVHQTYTAMFTYNGSGGGGGSVTPTPVIKKHDTVIIEGMYSGAAGAMTDAVTCSMHLKGSTGAYTVPNNATINVTEAKFVVYHSAQPDHEWTVGINLTGTATLRTVVSSTVHPNPSTSLTSKDVVTYTLDTMNSKWVSAYTQPAADDLASYDCDGFWYSSKTVKWSTISSCHTLTVSAVNDGKSSTLYAIKKNDTLVKTKISAGSYTTDLSTAKSMLNDGRLVLFVNASGKTAFGRPPYYPIFKTDGITTSTSRTYTGASISLSNIDSCSAKRGGTVYVVLDVEY